MKSKFNKSWNSSIQPRKQRKFLHNAPNHIKRKLLSAHLSKDLRKKYNIRAIEVIKNDEVKIMRGKFVNKMGKVTLIDSKKSRVHVDGIDRTRKDGEKVPIWIHASKILIIKLNDSDKKRFKHLKDNPKINKKETENAPQKK